MWECVSKLAKEQSTQVCNVHILAAAVWTVKSKHHCKGWICAHCALHNELCEQCTVHSRRANLWKLKVWNALPSVSVQRQPSRKRECAQFSFNFDFSYKALPDCLVCKRPRWLLYRIFLTLSACFSRGLPLAICRPSSVTGRCGISYIHVPPPLSQPSTTLVSRVTVTRHPCPP